MMGKINVNKVISKIFGDNPVKDVAVKDLILLSKGKVSVKIDNGVKRQKDRSSDENCKHDNKNSFGDSLERWAENMNLIDNIKNIIVQQVITLATLRGIQYSKGLALEATVEILAKEIENRLHDRFQSNTWMDWLKTYEDSEGENPEMLYKYHEIAVEGYKQGFIDGFADREKLSAKYHLDKPKENKMPHQCANTEGASLKYQP